MDRLRDANLGFDALKLEQYGRHCADILSAFSWKHVCS